MLEVVLSLLATSPVACGARRAPGNRTIDALAAGCDPRGTATRRAGVAATRVPLATCGTGGASWTMKRDSRGKPCRA
jgi:hypothetical protein